MNLLFRQGGTWGSALLHSVSLWYLGDETECRVGTPYIDRNFINSLPEAKVDQSESVFFAKNTFRICARATKFFLAPFHNFLAPNWGVFFQGGSLCEVCGQNVRNVGRRAVITANSHNHSMLIYMPLWDMWAECEKCGQKSCSLYVQWILVIY